MNYNKLFLASALLCCVSGCKRYYRWTKAQFEQVCFRKGCPEQVSAYVLSEDRYDGFNTVGHFDILWYAKPVMTWHFAQYVDRLGLKAESERYDQLWDEFTREYEAFIVFYLLMVDDTGDSLQKQFAVKEGETALWTASLVIDDLSYMPHEIKRMNEGLVPEIATCFGTRYDIHYRRMYKFLFKRPKKAHIAQARCVQFILKSATYQVNFNWRPQHLEPHGLPQEPIQ